jgi:hypothetical protein
MTKRAFPLLLALCLAFGLLSGCVTRLDRESPPQASQTPEEIAGLFAQLYITGEYQTAWEMFDETMKAAVGASDLQNAWDSVSNPLALGPFERVYSADTVMVSPWQ